MPKKARINSDTLAPGFSGDEGAGVVFEGILFAVIPLGLIVLAITSVGGRREPDPAPGIAATSRHSGLEHIVASGVLTVIALALLRLHLQAAKRLTASPGGSAAAP